MKRFHFRLQRVLDIKNTLEEQRKRELGEAYGLLATEQGRLNDIGKALSRAQQYAQQHGPLTSFLLLMYDHYITQQLVRTELQQQTIKQVQRVVDVRRGKLVTAYKDRKILDRLKERYTEQYRHEADREAQVLIDEISSAKYGRMIAAGAMDGPEEM